MELEPEEPNQDNLMNVLDSLESWMAVKSPDQSGQDLQLSYIQI